MTIALRQVTETFTQGSLLHWTQRRTAVERQASQVTISRSPWKVRRLPKREMVSLPSGMVMGSVCREVRTKLLLASCWATKEGGWSHFTSLV